MRAKKEKKEGNKDNFAFKEISYPRVVQITFSFTMMKKRHGLKK